jgi:tryptophan-rich sensory protein
MAGAKIMNKAQKRAWLVLTISIVTLLAAAAVIIFVHINHIDVIGLPKPTPIGRILGLVMTVPLILIVITAWRFPQKDFDERDKLIDHKTAIFGYMGGLIFLVGAGWFIIIANQLGTIKSLLIIYLIYLAYFVSVSASSIAALIQYGRGGGNE